MCSLSSISLFTLRALLEALLDKARSKVYGILHILTSSAPLSKRVDVLNTVVWGSMAWVVRIIFPTQQCQEMVNRFQYYCFRMLGISRGAQELWIDYESRSLRMARAVVHRMGQQRWGDRHLLAFWSFTGHRVRAGLREDCSAAGSLSHFRTLGWWQQQQNKGGGRRHGRHFPMLMNCERRLARAAGDTEWRVLACNRQQWADRATDWVRQEAVPWASGRQPALNN